MKIHVGCCGIPGGLRKYSQLFRVVEINSTFYRLPKLETALKWRSQVPEDFVFCLKAFQGITHPITSPTWKRSGIKDYQKLGEKVGFLRTSKEVLKFWEDTIQICRALRARVCLLQLPASFKESSENRKAVKAFFSKVKRDRVSIALELRGWDEDTFAALCKELDLIEVTDPFVRLPSYVKKVAYFRLHGSYNRGRINYNYRYSVGELRQLREKLNEVKADEIFVLFNNTYMRESAESFLKLI
ncbi:MAG: DUF72 domain-containing protein [Candidatus Nanoarchaeia archaeon]|nr:DUF72 domain-containing protein [Candidatus Haiyanarchaeum thermophilum]MCW1302866.1 DUF72 domain-containing protein [Candidatus Haiyanarchaeum thermophilum]MCW1303546.1 DUF72 domain-containing protein [Candidatus Haiyanarchaeum thermophilum]MCW1306228.1 DUF72 domain-containing protein [Candidatus Haiyanarchaeum thermophilum]MCW1307318.1 DUF72 domain-containing protein [Candidatus Haiyanarchaeum thermophilum]